MLVVKWGLGFNTEKGIFLSVNTAGSDAGSGSGSGSGSQSGAGDQTGGERAFSTRKLGGLRFFSPEFARRKNGISPTISSKFLPKLCVLTVYSHRKSLLHLPVYQY